MDRLRGDDGRLFETGDHTLQLGPDVTDAGAFKYHARTILQESLERLRRQIRRDFHEHDVGVEAGGEGERRRRSRPDCKACPSDCFSHDGANRRHVDTGEGINSMGMHLPGAAAADDEGYRSIRIAGEHDADFGEIRLSRDRDGVPQISHCIATAVPAWDHGPGDNDRHTQIAEHEGEGRRRVVHSVGAMQDYYAAWLPCHRLGHCASHQLPVFGHDAHAAFAQDLFEFEIDVGKPDVGRELLWIEVQDRDTVLQRAVPDRAAGGEDDDLLRHDAVLSCKSGEVSSSQPFSVTITVLAQVSRTGSFTSVWMNSATPGLRISLRPLARSMVKTVNPIEPPQRRK